MQAAHAALEFARQFPGTQPWRYPLALLAAPGEQELADLAERAKAAGVACAVFCEPDLGWELTAVALGPAAARLTRKYPLALREGVKPK